MHGLRVVECSRPHSTTLVLQSLDSAEWRPGYGPKVAGETDGCDGVAQVVTVLRDFVSLCDCFAQIQVLRETFVVSTRRCLAEAGGVAARSVGGGSYMKLVMQMQLQTS